MVVDLEDLDYSQTQAQVDSVQKVSAGLDSDLTPMEKLIETGHSGATKTDRGINLRGSASHDPSTRPSKFFKTSNEIKRRDGEESSDSSEMAPDSFSENSDDSGAAFEFLLL